MQRGDIYMADFAPRSGSEQSGLRPALLISTDLFNRRETWQSLIVVPFSTSDVQAKRGPSAVLISREPSGLRSDSVALCHQVTMLDRSKFGARIGRLSPEQLVQVEQGLLLTLGMLQTSR